MPAPSAPADRRAEDMPLAARLAALALVLLAVSLATWIAAAKSDTYDEPMYILAGYSYLVTGDFSINREHPPLGKLLLALPLLALDLELPAEAQQRPGIPFAFVFHQPHVDGPTIVFVARLSGIVLLAVLLAYVFRWARLLFGWRAALLSLALAATSPPLLAHAAIAGNDFPMAVFCSATLYHAWRWLQTGARGSLAAGAVMLGAALACKLTAVLLLPVIGLVVLLEAVRRRRPSLLGGSLAALLAAGGVLWLVYLGEARSLADARQHVRFRHPDVPDRVMQQPWLEDGLLAVFGEERPVPLLGLLKGLDMQLAHNEDGHVTYLRGERSATGFRSYYVQSWLMKNPIGFTLLLLLGLLSLPRTRRGLAPELLLYGFPALVLVVFSRANIQLGFTYVLPAVAPLAVAAGRLLAVRGARAPHGERLSEAATLEASGSTSTDGAAGLHPLAGPASPPPAAAHGPLVSRREATAGALLAAGVGLGGFLWFAEEARPRLVPWIALVLPAVFGAWLLLRARRATFVLSPTGPAALLGGWAALSSLAIAPDQLAHFNEWVGGRDAGWHYSVVRDDWGQDVSTLGRWMAEHDVGHVYYDKFSTGDPEAWGVRYTPTWRRPPPASSGWLAVHTNRLARNRESYRWLAGAEPAEILGGTILLYRLEDLPRRGPRAAGAIDGDATPGSDGETAPGGQLEPPGELDPFGDRRPLTPEDG